MRASENGEPFWCEDIKNKIDTVQAQNAEKSWFCFLCGETEEKVNNTLDTAQQLLTDIKTTGIPGVKVHADIKFNSDDIKTSLERTNATINNLKPSLDEATKTFKEFSETSLLNEKNAREAMKSCAFTTLGLFVCCCGTKMIYDSCQEIHTKITAEDNQNEPVTQILSWRDFVRPACGLAAIGIGYTIIARQ
jgi:hypothetical protein